MQVKIKVPEDVYEQVKEAAKKMEVDEKTFIRVALKRFAEVVTGEQPVATISEQKGND